MNQCVDEMNSIREVCVSVGIYNTPEEAADACTRKKLEYESCSEQGTVTDFEKPELQSKLSRCSGKKLGSVYQVKSGKWKAEIQRAKVKHKLGTYATAEDAREALNRKRYELGWEGNAEQSEKDYDSKRCELGLQADAEQSQKNQRPRGVYLRKSGRWQTDIRHPVTKANIYLGTFDTAEEAQKAKDSKRREFDSLFPPEQSRKIRRLRCAQQDEAAYSTEIDSTVCLGTSTEEAEGAYDSKQSNYRFDSHELGLKADAEPPQKNQRLRYVYRRKSGQWTTAIGHPITKARVCLGTFDTAEEAKEAYDSKRREFDLMFLRHKKRNQTEGSCNEKLKQSNDSCRGDSASSDGSLVIKSSREEMLNGIVEAGPMLGTEGRREFDSDVIDSYGQFVGEYSRLDDELWLCRPEDDATLQQDEGYEW